MPFHKTAAEVAAERAAAETSRRVSEAKRRAEEIATRKVIDDIIEDLPDEEVETLTYLYPEWETGVALAVGDKVRFNGILYRVVQAHTTQADWTPPEVPALFARFRDTGQTGNTPDAWVQPTGGHDAYQTGDRVTHDNPNDSGAIWIYESKINANTTEPGRDGTFDRWWQPVQPA